MACVLTFEQDRAGDPTSVFRILQWSIFVIAVLIYVTQRHMPATVVLMQMNCLVWCAAIEIAIFCEGVL